MSTNLKRPKSLSGIYEATPFLESSDIEHENENENIYMSLDLSDDEEFTQSAGNYPFEINVESTNDESHDYRYADLQDQLMAVVLENERLAAELEHVKYDEVKSLSSKLRAEKEKNQVLEDELRVKPLTPRRRKIAQSRRDILHKSRSMVELSGEAGEDDGDVSFSHLEPEIAQDALTMDDVYIGNSGFLRNRFSKRLKTWISKKYDELANDFSEVNTHIEVPEKEGDQLNPFKLKNNLIRVGNFLDPMEELLHSFGAITRWENPTISLMAFMIYMILIYKDWILSTIFLGIVSTFFFTYLRHKGWTFGNEVESITKSSNSEIEKDLGVRDQISILINVGRRSQNHAGIASDILEKIKNIVIWREPELTKPVVFILCCGFIATMLFPPYFLIKMAVLGAGIHVFVLQYIFSRFPRINKKYNKVEEFVALLKTDAQYEKAIKKIKKDLKKTTKLSRSTSALHTRSTTSLIPPVTPNANSVSLTDITGLDTPEIITPTSFHETFQLPVSESPLQAWKNGRRCFLVNKEKAFTTGFKLGRMYLTTNYICYERGKTASNKNLVIPLETIKSIKKTKLHHWVPGGGKSIEIKVKNNGKAFTFVYQSAIFGSIVNRDEAFDSILAIGTTNGYAWATAAITDANNP